MRVVGLDESRDSGCGMWVISAKPLRWSAEA